MNTKRLHPLWPTVAVLLSLFSLLLGERIFAGSDSMRLFFSALAAVLIGAALVVRVQGWLSADEAAKKTRKKLLVGTLLVAAGLALYALLAVVFTKDSVYHERWRGVLWGLWPVCSLLGVLPLISLETAVAPVAFNERYEQARVNKSYSRGLGLALFTAILFVGNYLVNRNDTKWNLSAGHKAVAGSETQRAISELTKDVEVVLFFPRNNDVADSTERYFEPLVKLNSKLSLRRVDHALAADVARKSKVTENGYVAIIRDKVSEKIRLGTKSRSARSALRRLDGKFLKALMKVTTEERVAYFTSGHGERAVDRADKDDKRPTLRSLKTLIESWQFKVQDLSVSNGLTEKIPSDANVVFIMGPKKPFLQAEIDTLLDATKRGIRVVVALDAEYPEGNMAGLLGPLGLKTLTGTVANLRANIPLTRTERDRTTVVLTKFSSHPSVTTNSRAPRKLGVLIDNGRALEAVKQDVLPNVKSEMVMHYPDDSFLDLNANLELDPDEKKKGYAFAAAITRTSTTGKKDDEARIWVMGDIDMWAEKMVKMVEGNAYVFRDVVLWLQRDLDVAPPTIAEDDVKIVHQKEDDALIFLGTIFGVPLLVLLAGLLVTRRRS